MDRDESRALYRYFQPADRFVRIRLADSAQAVGFSPGMDRAAYRRETVARCVEEWEIVEGLADPEGAEEALYQLVVEVNPDLDIQRVRLPESPAPEPVQERSAPPPEDDDRTLQKRLRKIAGSVEERLSRRIVGQEPAVRSVSRSVRRAALGWSGRGPLASLLFIGPTGVGKTELARGLAQELGGERCLVRVDCSEFAEGHEYAKLIGAPPGYVGHTEGGVLSRALANAPQSVILFDEVEKAHSRLHHLLLQVLDEGHVTDGRGQRVDFSRAFVVLTSNLGTRELQEADRTIGFVQNEPEPRTREDIVKQALYANFSPEFLARLDETVVFRNLGDREALRIAQSKLTELAARVRRSGPKVRFSTAVARWVARHAFSREKGARAIEHWIRREIEAPMAEEILGDERGRRGWLSVSIRGRRPRFERS